MVEIKTESQHEGKLGEWWQLLNYRHSNSSFVKKTPANIYLLNTCLDNCLGHSSKLKCSLTGTESEGKTPCRC